MVRLAEEGKTLEEIDPEKEILNIRKEAREQSAKARLKLLETGKYDFPYYSEKMLAELEDARIAPEKIGITKEKLRELKIKWAENRVAGFIKSVELGGDKDVNLGLIKGFLAANKLDLCHVDSDEDTIRGLLDEAHRHFESEQAIVLAPKEAKGKSHITAIPADGE